MEKALKEKHNNKQVQFDPAFLKEDEERKRLRLKRQEKEKEISKIEQDKIKNECRRLFDQLTDSHAQHIIDQWRQRYPTFARELVNILDALQIPAGNIDYRIFQAARHSVNFDQIFDNNEEFADEMFVLLSFCKHKNWNFTNVVTPPTTPERKGAGGRNGGGGGDGDANGGNGGAAAAAV